MIYWSRRKTLIGIAAIAAAGVAARSIDTANAVAALPASGVDADSDFMDNQLREFFGAARGRYLPEPRWPPKMSHFRPGRNASADALNRRRSAPS